MMVRLLRQDFARGAAAAAVGCAVWAAVEYVATLIAAPELDVGACLRLIALDAVLVALVWVPLALVCGGAAVIARLLLRTAGRARAEAWGGLFGPVRAEHAAPSPWAAWLWALAVAAPVYVGLSYWRTVYFITHFKAPQVIALALAVQQLAMIAVAGLVAYFAFLGFRAAGRALHERLGRANPFGFTLAAAVVLVALASAGVWIVVRVMPQLGPLVPWRHGLAAIAFAGGAYGARLLFARRALLPAAGRERRIALAGIAVFWVVVVPVTLVWIGAHQATKQLAVTGSPPLNTAIDVVRKANDFDRDGFGSLLGETDCAPFDRAIHPMAREIPDNGIDENCNGRDLSLSEPPSYQPGERLAVPEEYLQDWNVLLITVDTLRYDHTGFGGYERDTTPNLDALVERSVSFSFANAPSAGTMASVPAIATSKFFHSGIALSGERKPKHPSPRVLDENTLIAEVMKRGGYHTGAIFSHYYFTDWGLEQGFDDFDNEVGGDKDPYKITSHTITDKTLAWISKQGRRKWFLWVHYLDPHGHYVEHPGGKSFAEPGAKPSKIDLYDGEIHYTDHHLGRLFDQLGRMPGAERTIIVITSDHGDGFKEHGHENHGMALFKEMIHVPLIVYIPDVYARVVDGAVSPLDILPTIADVCGIDVSDLAIEGVSLVPQLFYGRDAHDRVVFSETNYPYAQRAAVTSRYKLIKNLQANVYELFALDKDPWEKKNVWNKDRRGSEEMARYLDDWLERVFFARDDATNQAAQKRAWHLLTERPAPKHPAGHVLDGSIKVLGFDTDKDSYAPGDKLVVTVYFEVVKRPSADFKLRAEAWQDGPGRPARSGSKYTADGMLPTGAWRPGELIRDKMAIRLPATWKPGQAMVGIALADKTVKASVQGATRPDDPNVAALGAIAVTAPAAQNGGKNDK